MVNCLIKRYNHKIFGNLVYVLKKLKVKLEIYRFFLVNQPPLGDLVTLRKSLIKGDVNKRIKQNLNLVLMIGNGGKGTKGNLQNLAMIAKKQRKSSQKRL